MVRTVEPLAVLTIRTLIRSSFAAYAMLASNRGCVICASGSEPSCVIQGEDGIWEGGGPDPDEGEWRGRWMGAGTSPSDEDLDTGASSYDGWFISGIAQVSL